MLDLLHGAGGGGEPCFKHHHQAFLQDTIRLSVASCQKHGISQGCAESAAGEASSANQPVFEGLKL